MRSSEFWCEERLSLSSESNPRFGDKRRTTTHAWRLEIVLPERTKMRLPTSESIEGMREHMTPTQLEAYRRGDYGVYGGVGLPVGSSCPSLSALFRADGTKFQGVRQDRLTVLNFGSST